IKTWIDRHRLIEIIVNLVNNAVDALGEVERSDRKVVIRVRERRGTIEIRVSDNGPGVTAPHRAKIFSYGYSTKPHGHGFGLHSSFNAATELGGWLRLETDAGEGAAFSLLVPRRDSKDTLRRVPGQAHTSSEPTVAEDDAAIADAAAAVDDRGDSPGRA